MTGNLDSSMKVKLFNMKGETETLTSEDRLSLNGAAKETAETVLGKLKAGGSVKKQLITYEVNAEGKLTKINTAKDLSSDSLKIDKENFVLNYKASDAVYNKTSGKLGNFKITDSTVVFDIPAASQDEDDYAIKNKSMFDNDGVYDVEIYDVDEDLTAKIVLVKNSTGLTNVESPIAVIDEITTVRNSKDETVQKLYAIVDGKRIELETAESNTLVNASGEKLQTGDIIQYRTNSSGAIDKISVLFEVKDKAAEFKKTDGDMDLIYGKVERKFANSINVTVNNGAVENYSLDNVKVVSVDTEKTNNSVTVSDAGDIQKYDELSPRRVFIRIYDHVVKEIVIIK